MELKPDWLSEFTLVETLEITRTLALYEAEQSGSFRHELVGLIDRRDYEGLLCFDFRYNENRAVMDYVHARQAVAFFEKLEPLGELLGLDREAAAYAKFLDSEEACRRTNEVFNAYRWGKLCFTPAFERVLYAAKWKIEKVLGPAPCFTKLEPKLGPGATTTVKRKKACPAEKLGATLSCSTSFTPFLPFLPAVLPHVWAHHAVKTVDGEFDVETLEVLEEPGKLSFVAKDAKSYRSIVVEPLLNSMYQLAVGECIAARLKHQGIDISNQVTNQNLARYGSVSGALATLDLSSASDTVSTELVRFLLPDDWYSLLKTLRSAEIEYDGRPITLEKFSSMGNGFTFPLETLIFYALTWASSPHRERSFISAYGDDIICSSSSAPDVIWALEACGFSINRKKSFAEGPFRESCGADYYRGVDIRPFRLKELWNNERLFILHNFYKRRFDEESAQLVRSFIHPDVILWGPDGYGDGHLISPDWPRTLYKRDLGYGGYTFDTYTLRAKKSFRRHPGDYLHVLYTNYVYKDVVRGPEGLGIREGIADWAEKPSIGNSKGEVQKTYPLTDNRMYKRISVHTLAR